MSGNPTPVNPTPVNPAPVNPAPWRPITNPLDLMHLGKLGEELNEAATAIFRCIIQGVDEYEPTTGKPNVEWLEEEIADVLANVDLVIDRFGLNTRCIEQRVRRKKDFLRRWHEQLRTIPPTANEAEQRRSLTIVDAITILEREPRAHLVVGMLRSVFPHEASQSSGQSNNCDQEEGA